MGFVKVLLVVIALLLARANLELTRIKHDVRSVRGSFSVILDDAEMQVMKGEAWT